jgi:hypothetical protein
MDVASQPQGKPQGSRQMLYNMPIYGDSVDRPCHLQLILVRLYHLDACGPPGLKRKMAFPGLGAKREKTPAIDLCLAIEPPFSPPKPFSPVHIYVIQNVKVQ